MEHRIRVNILGAAAVVALGVASSVITSTVVAARAYQAHARLAARESRDISVKGSTRQRIRSDLGVWRINVRGEGAQLAAAFAVLDAGTGKVADFLRSKSFPAAEVQTGPIQTTTFFCRDAAGHETREISSYAMERTITVTSADVDRIAGAANEVTQLLRDGVNVASQHPDYYYTKAADLKVQLLGAATKDARARADEIAANSGSRVAEVRRAQMGIIQITQPNSTDVSAGGMYDTSTIEKDVSVVVTLELGLDG